MKTLFIDTHLYNIDILLFEDDKLIKEGHVVDKKQNSAFLMPTVKDVLDNETYDQISVVNGPGSFTGVRLGVTVAKTLAYTMEKDIKVVSYFDLMNYSSNDEHHLFGMDDSNGYFIGEYENHKQVGEYIYINNADFAEYSKDKNIETDIKLDFNKILEFTKDLEPVNPHGVKPIYVKLIGVEYDKKN